MSPHLEELDVRRFVVKGAGNELADGKSLKDMIDDLVTDYLNDATHGLAAIEALVDDLESRLTAARAGYLDNLNNSKLLKLPIEPVRFMANTSLAGGLTRYMSNCNQYPAAGGASANETDFWVAFLVTRAGTLKNLVCRASGAPTAGESYVFTIRKNGADTTLTVTISDTNTNGINSSNTVTVAIGDVITLKIVTSAGAASQTHVCALEFEGA